jgi:hypothetical protein
VIQPSIRHFCCLFILILCVVKLSNGQAWNFVKEKDEIKIYTRTEPNHSFKSFKGETIFHASMDKVCAMLGNAMNRDWWDKNITGIKVIACEENKFIEYYLVYKMPWPISDRDLVAYTTIAIDPASRAKTYTADPLSNVVPENPDIERIHKYHQKWTIRPLEYGNVHVILDGYVDPGGNVPAWLYNMIVSDAPFKSIHSLRERVFSNKTVK